MPQFKQSAHILSRDEHGFTLLEIIVVTAIIGIMATLLVGALIQDNDRVAKLEAERFLAVIAELQDEAVLVGLPFSLSFSNDSYTTTTGLSESSVANNDSLLRERKLQEGVSLDSEVFSIDDQFESDDNAAKTNVVLIDTMGETTDFEVRFGGDDTEYIVFIDEQGQLTMKSNPL